MMKTIDDVEIVVLCLTQDEKRLLKDAIIEGWWGDAEYKFLKLGSNPSRNDTETVACYAYHTCLAVNAGNYKGWVVTSLFSRIYEILCPCSYHKVGEVVSHCPDWWGVGTGDMLFIRRDWCMAFHEWARDL